MTTRSTCKAGVVLVIAGMVTFAAMLWAIPPARAIAQDQSVATEQAPPDATIRAFVDAYCVKCHGGKLQKGERRFDQLIFPVGDTDGLAGLQDMLDQLNLGAMPPKEAKQPEEVDLRQAIDALTAAVAEAHDRLSSTGGKTVLRRLNRREYRNTVGDLFGLNMTMFDPTSKFPADETVRNMDNIGETLRTTGYLLDQYLDAADQVVERAFRLEERPAEQTWLFNGNFHQQPEIDKRYGSVDLRYLRLYETPLSLKYNGAYVPILEFAEGVPTDGFYEIKVKTLAVDRLQPYDPSNASALEPGEPFRLGIVPGNRKAGTLHHPQPIEPLLAETTLGESGPEWHTFKVWLDAGFTPRFTFPNGMTTEDIRRLVVRRPGKYIGEKIPHIQIHEVQIRGPLYDNWPPAGQRLVFGGPTLDPGRTPEVLQAFVSRAFRRPPSVEELDGFMHLVEERQRDGQTALQALKAALKGVLCSPAFLYLAEPEPGDAGQPLPAHALASRLSYFLWSSMPDEELRALADNGELLQPEVLAAQTRRLLSSPRSDSFVAGVLDSWLNLRSLGDMPPDRVAFERYYADDLQNSMRRETQLFTRDLLDRNDSIVKFLDADYTFVNRSLARLYGMADAVPAAEENLFRRVSLSDSDRGGLLGQASVLTVTANGVETSPVTRGVWLLENILGTPPAPPPDDVPAIEPDLRGAKTMREILSKHRANPACYECHRKIDPLGFALESFDPIGVKRDHYEFVEVDRHEARRAVGAAVDTSGELPDGSTFENIAGLRRILVERKTQFARTLTERLLGYGCGRQIERLDRPHVDRIVEDLGRRGYGFRDLIELVVQSETFRSK